MSDNCDCIFVLDEFTTIITKIVQHTCGRKINSNQEPQDRYDKRPILIRERQVGLRTATSFRPLLLLNISAIGRDSGVVVWRGHQGNGPPPPLLFITLLEGGDEALLHWPDPPTVSFPTLVHHCTLFIRRNLNYTFDRTSRRTIPPRFQSERDATMLNTSPVALRV